MTLIISRTKHSHDPQDAPTVEQVQVDLLRRGYSVGPSGADGVFGAYSEGAVIRFQRRHGLRVDGQVGRDTWKALQHRGLLGSAERAAQIAYNRVTGEDGHGVPRYRFGAEVTNLSTKYPSELDCCLVGESLVQTTRGPVPIAEIEPGDEVYGWDEGHLVVHPVLARKEQATQDVFAVRTRNRTVKASANHPFLRLTRTPGRRNTRRGFAPVDWRTEWARVDELKRGDLIVVLDHLDDTGQTSVLSDGTELSEDIAWLLGLIVGDGHITANGVSIAVYGDTRVRAAQILRDTWGLVGRESEHAGLAVSSVHLRDVLTALGMKRLGPVKRVPEIIFRSPLKVIAAFLAGYCTADGHTDKKRGYLCYSSASWRLISEVRMLHIALGHAVSNFSTNHRTKPITIKGKLVKQALPLHTFEVYPGSTRSGQALAPYGVGRQIPDDRFRVERLLAVDAAGTAPTYDIEVDGCHNFVADGVVVHNSELVQWSIFQATTEDWRDGSANQAAACHLITVSAALKVKGALLFESYNGHPSGVHHVAWSMGDGTTAEARSRYMSPECGSWKVQPGRFQLGGLVSGVLTY